MFAELPKDLRQKVVEELENNDFPAAKKIYDDWHQSKTSAPAQPLPH